MAFELSGCSAWVPFFGGGNKAFLDGKYSLQEGGYYSHEQNDPSTTCSLVFLYYHREERRWHIGGGQGNNYARSCRNVSSDVPPPNGWSLFTGYTLYPSPWTAPAAYDICLTQIEGACNESVEALKVKVSELTSQLEMHYNSSDATTEALKSDLASSREATQRARHQLEERDIELDQLRVEFNDSEQCLGEVLKARGLHDTRSTIDSQFPSTVEMLGEVKNLAVDQSLKSLVECMRVELRSEPSSIVTVLNHLFFTLSSLIDDRFRRFDLCALIDESVKQRQTLESSLRSARETLFGMTKIASTESRKAAFGEILGIAWEEWDLLFSGDAEMRDDMSRWYLEVCYRTLKFEVDRRLCGVVEVDWSTVGQPYVMEKEQENPNCICKKRREVGETINYIVFPRLTCTDPAFPSASVPAYVIAVAEPAVDELSSANSTFSCTAIDTWKKVLPLSSSASASSTNRPPWR